MIDKGKADVINAAMVRVWRIGRYPHPWAWTPKKYSGHNRWDDPQGRFRTIYAGDSAFSCFAEVLAFARSDEVLVHSIEGIYENHKDSIEYPTPPAAVITEEWRRRRMIAWGVLTGHYVDVRSSATVAWLHPVFLAASRNLGFEDFDQSVLKSSNRLITQSVAAYIYEANIGDSDRADGICYASRHGDDLRLWTIMQRPGDGAASTKITPLGQSVIAADHPALQTVARLFRLVVE